METTKRSIATQVKEHQRNVRLKLVVYVWGKTEHNVKSDSMVFQKNSSQYYQIMQLKAFEIFNNMNNMNKKEGTLNWIRIPTLERQR